MKKRILIIFIVIGVIQAILWGFDILRFYKYPTVANEPNLKEGAKFAWSSFVKPKRLDFICFKAKDTDFGEYEAAMRLVALPDDVLQIKNGNLFVNDIRIDETIDLRRLYKCDKDYFYEKVQSVVKNKSYGYYEMHEDSMAVYMDYSDIKKSNLKLSRLILPKAKIDGIVKSIYKKDWNMDNFGPLKIPENMFFVLGDNRENSMDSRYLGFISKDDVLGTVIYKTN